MSDSSWTGDEDEDQDESNLDDEFRSFDDNLIFLIDARLDMFRKHSNYDTTYMVNSLRVVHATMKAKIIATDRDSIGVFLFGTGQKNSALDGSIENTYSLLPLDTPSADSIKTIQNFIQNPIELENLVGHQPDTTNTCPLKTSLWACAQAFTVKSKKTASRSSYRRIWIFTNDDNPNAHDAAEQARIIQVAKDAYETGIEIALWCYNPPGHTQRVFNCSLFYDRLLRTVDDTSDADVLSRIQRAENDSFDHLLREIRRKEYSKRQMGSISLHLSSTLHIAVKMYKLIAPAKKPLPVWLVANTLRRTSTTSRYLNSNTAAPVDTSEISTYVDVNGYKLEMTKSEMDSAKENAWVGSGYSSVPTGEGFLKVLHFIDESVFGGSFVQDYPVFIHPDESRVKGSATLFTALLQDMVAKKVVGVALYARTKRASPRVVVMLPLLEADGGDGEPEVVGCNLIPLPFDGECRRSINTGIAYDLENMSGVDGLVEAANPNIHSAIASAETLIRKLQLGETFDYRDLENPAIQNFYAVLQAVALSQSQTEWSPEDDMLQPSPEHLAAASEEIAALCHVTGCDQGSAHTTGSKSKKRSADADKESAGKASSSSKKSKAEDGSLAKKTVAELKEMCKELKLPVSGTKQVLIDRLEELHSK